MKEGRVSIQQIRKEGEQRFRNVIRRHSFPLLVVLLLLFSIAAPDRLKGATVYEWTIGSEHLEERITSALLRYYGVIRRDSLFTRYVRQKSGRLLYEVRAEFVDETTRGEILLLSLGQLRLFPSENIRIALGENLYDELLASRNEPTANRRRIDLGDSFGHHDWRENYRVIWSVWERLDVRIEPELQAFVAFGAPESNLDFWGDGTGRIGCTSPLWEFALLFPFSSGGVGFGPLPERLLVPGYGASASLRFDRLTARIRFTDATEGTFNSTRAIDRSFVHSLSSGLVWEDSFGTGIGSFSLTAGVGLEEFTELEETGDGEIRHDGYVRRISPIAGLAYTTPDENLQFRLGVNDLAIRPELTVRLSSGIWIEGRAVVNTAFRDAKVFEHPFAFFLTPRLKF